MWQAGLRDTRNGRKLIASVRVALEKYFVDKGTTAGEVDTTPPEGGDQEAKDDYLAEWEGYAQSAGITDATDIKNVGRFFKQLTGEGPLSRIMVTTLWQRLLVANGVTMSASSRQLLQDAMLASQTGTTHEQCTSMLCIMIVYLGRVGTAEDLQWLEPQLAAAVRADAAQQGAASTGCATVDLKGMPSYAKQHQKTLQMSLERALQACSPDLWNHYSARVMDQLCSHGLPQAGQRLMKIATLARQQFRDDWASEREYLVHVFFDLWAGRGLLEEFSVRASVLMQGSVAARQMRLQVSLSPVPGQLLCDGGQVGTAFQAPPVMLAAGPPAADTALEMAELRRMCGDPGGWRGG